MNEERKLWEIAQIQKRIDELTVMQNKAVRELKDLQQKAEHDCGRDGGRRTQNVGLSAAGGTG